MDWTIVYSDYSAWWPDRIERCSDSWSEVAAEDEEDE